MATFVELLRRACRNCKASSIKTYAANIRALAKLAGLAEVPTHKRWLGDKLLAKVRAMPLQRYQHGGSSSIWCEEPSGIPR